MDKKIHLLYEWNEITYPSPSLNGAVVGILEQLNSILLNSFYCRTHLNRNANKESPWDSKS